MITDIEAYLGYHEVNDAIIVGAGKLGQALLSYTGFRDYGLNIVAAFDTSPESKDPDESGKRIYPVEELDVLQKISDPNRDHYRSGEFCAGGLRPYGGKWNPCDLT